MKFTLSNPLFGANDLIKVPKLYTIFFFLIFNQKSVHRTFLGHWIRISCKNLEIKNGGSNMAIENARSN